MEGPLRELVVVAFRVSFFLKGGGVIGRMGTYLPG